MTTDSSYQTPHARLEQTSPPIGSKITIKKNESSKGADWLFDGFRRVFQSPSTWAGIGVINLVLLLIFTAFSIIPIVGALIPSLLYPVVVAGFMQAAANQDRGQLSVSDLFAGFSSQSGQLFLAGALYIAMLFGVLLLIIASGAFIDVSDLTLYDTQPLLILLAALLFMALSLPIVMAMWFTPALIMLLKVEAIEAIKLSFKACMRNFLAFLAYGVATLALMFFVMIVVGILVYGVGLTASIEHGKPTTPIMVAFALVCLPMTVWGAPVMFCSVYQSYLDIFGRDHEPSTNKPASTDYKNNGSPCSEKVITRR